MNARKVVAGSVLAAGLGAAGMMGAGTALAGPGVSFDNGTGGTGAIGFGDRSATGATAIASPGNRALAVNLTSKGSVAIADGKNNNVVAIDGVAVTGPGVPGSASGTKNNNVVAAFGRSTVDGTAHNNNVVTVGGGTGLSGGTGLGADNHNNTVLNVGGRVATTLAQEGAPGALSVSVCGTSLTGQADQIEVTDPGICSGGA